MGKQHLALWRDTCNMQRQARELILGLDWATGAQLLSLNRTQTKVVIGLLTGHNTLKRHLCIMGIGNGVLRRRPQSTFYVSVRPWPHSGTLPGFLLFGPRQY